jgi:hypothetical protein
MLSLSEFIPWVNNMSDTGQGVHIMKTSWPCLLTATAAIALFFGDGRGATIRVDGAGGGDALTISAGIQLTADGDTLLIAPGVYPESEIQVDRSITIRGDQGDWPTVDGGGGVVVFHVAWPKNPSFRNLIIQDGAYGILSRNGGADCTGPASFWSASNLVLYRLTSAGLAADNYACTVGNALWSNITAIECGIGYSINDYGTVLASRVVALDCEAGISGFNYGSASFDCAVFWGNSVDSGGGQPVAIGRLTGADPLVCDAAGGRFGVAAGSPCLPENNLCGQLIGAQGAACTAPAGVETPEPEGQAVEIERVSPNPLPSNCTGRIEFSRPRSGKTGLEIFDVCGRRVWTWSSTTTDAADSRWLSFEPGALPSGVYVLRASTGDVSSATTRVVILR